MGIIYASAFALMDELCEGSERSRGFFHVQFGAVKGAS
jgi:hypothetical protein